MKVKILFLSLCILAFSGCSATYDLTIDKNNITEDVFVTVPKIANQTNSYNNLQIPITQNTEEKTFYNYELLDNNTNYELHFNYKHTYQSFQNSYFVTRCYQNVNLLEEEDKLTLNTSNEFLCLNLEDGAVVDNVQLRIKTNLDVIQSNADEVNENTYIWNITNDNYQNKPVNIEIQKGITIIDENTPIALYVAIGIAIILIILIFLFIKSKRKIANNF